MAKGTKKTTNQKTTTKPVETPSGSTTTTTKQTTNTSETTVKPTKSSKTNNLTQTVIIAILSTALICFVLIFGILLATGVIKFGHNDNHDNDYRNNTSYNNNQNHDNHPSTPKDDDDRIVDNTNPRVNVNGTHVSIDELDFYLPYAFEAGGKNNDGAYTYNLTNDDGWAQVLVYTERTNLSPEKYLTKIAPYLEINDEDYDFNGTDWTVGENANSLAYATKIDGKVYAIYYNVKLDSNATSEAMQMIPKTLYMSKIYAD